MQAGQSVLALANDFDGSDVSPIWIEFHLQPVRFSSPVHEAVGNLLETDVTAAFYFLEGNQIAILDGDGQAAGTWSVVDHPASTTDWTQVLVRNDYAAQEFQLWINGTLTEGSFGFANKQPYFNRLMLKQNDSASAYLDGIHISAESPAGLDADSDGMSDGWELAYGLDPLDPADAASDIDGDLLTNFQEFTFGTNPTLNDTDGDGLQDGYALPGFVRREIWNDVYSNRLGELIHRSDFPENPDELQWLDKLETAIKVADTYGDRTRGFIVPTESGDYVFYVSGNANTELWLSTDDHAFNKQRIAVVTTETHVGDWDAFPEQTSETISLAAGTRYYFEVLHSEGYRSDHYKVGWSRSDAGGSITIISGENLLSWQPDPLDADDDGLEDTWEIQQGLDPSAASAPLDGAYGDFDSDGLSNLTERNLGTSPTVSDSDNDGYDDGIEHLEATSADDSADVPIHLLASNAQTTLIGQGNFAQAYELGDGKEVLFASGEGFIGDFGYHGTMRDIPASEIFDVIIRVDSFTSSYLESSGEFGLVIRSSDQAVTDSVGIYRNNDAFYAMRTIDNVPQFQDGSLSVVSIGDGPVWLRMVKATDSTITVFYSLDGSAWTELASHPWLIEQTPIFGLYAASGNAVELSKTVFEIESVDVDSDGDGLLDFEEIAAGTDPQLADTDGDGFSDAEELLFLHSDPTVADLEGPPVVVGSVDGSGYSTTRGIWGSEGTELYSLDSTGSVGYTLNFVDAGAYRIVVKVAEHNIHKSSISTFDLRGSLDGVDYGIRSAIVSVGEVVELAYYLPYLPAGDYAFDLDWLNGFGDSYLRIQSIRVEAIGGVDADQNGIADWIEDRATRIGSDQALPLEIYTSPFCFEGTSFAPATVAIASHPVSGSANIREESVQQALDNSYYANVELLADEDRIVLVDDQSGLRTGQHTLTWAAFNAVLHDFYHIRLDDSMLLTAIDDSLPQARPIELQLTAPDGTVETHSIAAAARLQALFDQAGDWQLQAQDS